MVDEMRLGLQAAVVEHLGGERGERRVEPPRRLQEEPSIRGHRRPASEHVGKGRSVGAGRVASAHWLIKLLRVAHSADEYVPIAEVEACAQVLAEWVRRELIGTR